MLVQSRRTEKSPPATLRIASPSFIIGLTKILLSPTAIAAPDRILMSRTRIVYGIPSHTPNLRLSSHTINIARAVDSREPTNAAEENIKP